VFFVFPKRADEKRLLAQYHAEDSAAEPVAEPPPLPSQPRPA
jgi:hypothetical protein